MTQESGGADPHINPPSFIPAGNRRTRPSGQVPRSFAPARTSRQSGQAPSARPSVTGNDIEEPQLNANATASANVADNGRRTPPSFSPKTGRATRSTAPDAAAPRSIPPSRARMSSGSSRNAVRNPSDMPVSRPSSPAANVSTKFSHLGRPAAATAKTVTARRPRALRITLCAIAVLVAALILSVFGAWQWVDSKLNRSDWLTDTPNTPASTWLILGSDERDGSTDYGGVDNISGFRTDTILVLIKPKSGPSSLVSIPRDSLMNVDNQYMKINAVALIAGKKALVSNVEQITGQKIDHVAQIKFGGLQNVVNALGGIELCYDEDVQDSYSGLNWKAGCHTADGSTALSFSRMRYADARGDFGRNERQRQVISAIVKKASFVKYVNWYKKTVTYIPYYFEYGGKIYFLKNLATRTGSEFGDRRERNEMAALLRNLRGNRYEYCTFYSQKKDIFEFFDWLRKNKYTLEIQGDLFDFADDRSHVDFHGNVCEYSAVFHYRIYSRKLFGHIINQLRTVKRYHAWHKRREIR